MEQLTSNAFVETQIRGCNHGFVTTSEGVVMIDSPHKPSDALKLKAEIAKHGELRYIINTEPHGDHCASPQTNRAVAMIKDYIATRLRAMQPVA